MVGRDTPAVAPKSMLKLCAVLWLRVRLLQPHLSQKQKQAIHPASNNHSALYFFRVGILKSI